MYVQFCSLLQCNLPDCHADISGLFFRVKGKIDTEEEKIHGKKMPDHPHTTCNSQESAVIRRNLQKEMRAAT